MKLGVLTLAIVLLPAVAGWGQDAPAAATVPPPAAQSVRSASRTPRGVARNQRMKMAGADASFEGRLQEMQNTLTQMHVLLQDMQARTSNSKSVAAKTATAKAGAVDTTALADNVRMWELLLNHLDSTMAQARMTAMQRAMAQRGAPSRIQTATPVGGMPVLGGAESAPAPIAQP